MPNAALHPSRNERAAKRLELALPVRLTWKKADGATQFASVVTRNVSQYGVYVECASPVSIPLFRLVQFQLDVQVDSNVPLPASLRHGRILSAVYRIVPPTSYGALQGLALRLMVDPHAMRAMQIDGDIRATA